MTITATSKVIFKGKCKKCGQGMSCDDIEDLRPTPISVYFGDCIKCGYDFVAFYGEVLDV